jgi:hypothetical protein
MHHKLKLPETDTELSLQSSTEEMRTGSSYSSSTKGLCFEYLLIEFYGLEQRPLSPIMIVETSLEPVAKKFEEIGASGETTPRLPFQLLQHHSGEADDGKSFYSVFFVVKLQLNNTKKCIILTSKF